MYKLFALIALILTLAFSGAATEVFAQGNHEYAPLVEKAINYKDWTFKSLKDDKPVNLREWSKGKRLVMIVYFAPWCPNWHNEAPVAAKLYEKYKLQGFDVIGVSEYGTREDTQKFFGEKGAPYTIVYESESREQRDKTSHYTVRQASGDTRRWGSPYNVFLEPSKLTKDGEVVTEKAWVVNGELIEADVEKFIRERLGLDTKAQSVLNVTPCQQ
jgi:thiol-disulfide isomerase/thioredoxin